MIFGTTNDVISALANNLVAYNTLIGLGSNAYPEKKIPNGVLITTPGKVIFNNALPADFPYVNDAKNLFTINEKDIVKHGEDVRNAIKNHVLNTQIIKSNLQAIVLKLNSLYPVHIVAETMDKIKDVCFNYSTYSCVTFSMLDFPEYNKKQAYFSEADAKIQKIKELYNDGLLTDDERYVMTIDI
ncbi:hypothetical protein FACS189459_3650 [Bacilli bacterium]|nr:hypothetical protein FACS189459_3650 [Bacilli bacterium]